MKAFAFIASLIVPGTGQFLTRRPKAGLVWFVAHTLIIAAVLMLSLYRVHRVPTLLAPLGLMLRPLSAVETLRADPDAIASWRALAAGWSIALALLVLRVAFVEKYLWEPFRIRSMSMFPTLLNGDVVEVNRQPYVPRRGDVVVFVSPADRREYAARVVGTAGDSVVVLKGGLIVNGAPVPLSADAAPCPFVSESNALVRCHAFYEWFGKRYHEIVLTDPDPDPEFATTLVPEDSIFVAGDNRDDSVDSRSFGPVPLSDVVGRVTFSFSSHRNGKRPRLLLRLVR